MGVEPTDISDRVKSSIIRRWKRIFLGIYLAFTCSVSLLALLSIVAVHCGAYHIPIKGERIGITADDPKQLGDCHRKLKRLMTDLHRQTVHLQAKALRFDVDPSVEWSKWSDGWRNRWRVINWRCRLSDLSGQEDKPEINNMASIHMALDELQLSYTGVMNTFVDRNKNRLHKLQDDFANVRKMIERRRSSISQTRSRSHGAKR